MKRGFAAQFGDLNSSRAASNGKFKFKTIKTPLILN